MNDEYSEVEIQQRFDATLLAMLRMPPDPHNVRTKENAGLLRGARTAPKMVTAILELAWKLPAAIRDDAVQHAFMLMRAGKYRASQLQQCMNAAVKLARRDERGGHSQTYSLDRRVGEGLETFKDLLPSHDESEGEECS